MFLPYSKRLNWTWNFLRYYYATDVHYLLTYVSLLCAYTFRLESSITRPARSYANPSLIAHILFWRISTAPENIMLLYYIIQNWTQIVFIIVYTRRPDDFTFIIIIWYSCAVCNIRYPMYPKHTLLYLQARFGLNKICNIKY